MTKKIITVFLLLSCLLTLSAKGINIFSGAGLFSTTLGISSDFGPWQAGGVIGTPLPQYMIGAVMEGKKTDETFKEALAAGTSISLYADRSVLSGGFQCFSAGLKLSLLVCPAGLPAGTSDMFALAALGVTAKWETGYGKRGGFFAETSIPLLLWACATDFKENTRMSSLTPVIFTDADDALAYLKLAMIFMTRIGYTWHL